MVLPSFFHHSISGAAHRNQSRKIMDIGVHTHKNHRKVVMCTSAARSARAFLEMIPFAKS
jgi:hypothetical protein